MSSQKCIHLIILLLSHDKKCIHLDYFALKPWQKVYSFKIILLWNHNKKCIHFRLFCFETMTKSVFTKFFCFEAITKQCFHIGYFFFVETIFLKYLFWSSYKTNSAVQQLQKNMHSLNSSNLKSVKKMHSFRFSFILDETVARFKKKKLSLFHFKGIMYWFNFILLRGYGEKNNLYLLHFFLFLRNNIEKYMFVPHR